LPDHLSPDEKRVVIYRNLAYRRLADGMVATWPAEGRPQAVAHDAVPLPVRHALNITARS
jgi:hypothetical protein